jgi:hypothetical protein
MKEDSDLCVRCKRKKATMTYAAGYMDFAHGMTERICKDCYDIQMKDNEWYKQGFRDGLKAGKKSRK